MHDPTDARAARIIDARHLLYLVSCFPALPFPAVSGHMASFSYSDETDAEAAAESVRTAEGILSRQMGVTFEGRHTEPVGSAAHYQRTARLDSGMHIHITARAEVGPLIEAREDADAKVPVAA